MERKINKTYINIEENGLIKNAFCQFGVSPHYSAIGMNFDETKDFSTALETDIDINEIEIGKSTYINGVFTSNKEVAE